MLHASCFMEIIGHQKIISLLDRSIEKDCVANAYIFSGPESVGKFTVALNFAEKLLGRVRTIDSDLIIIEPEIEEKKGIIKKRGIKIEKIRELQHELGLSIGEGRYKVAIINDADRLNRSAQNALLKNLEEPLSGTVIILVVQDEKRILPTISSRCQRIKFNLVADAELGKNIPAEIKSREEILFWSLGRPGLMMKLISESEELKIREEALKELAGLPERSVAEKFSLAEKLSKDLNFSEKKLNFWIVALRRSILETKSPIKMEKNRMLELLEEMEKGLGLIKDTNSNPRLVLENILLLFQ